MVWQWSQVMKRDGECTGEGSRRCRGNNNLDAGIGENFLGGGTSDETCTLKRRRKGVQMNTLDVKRNRGWGGDWGGGGTLGAGTRRMATEPLLPVDFCGTVCGLPIMLPGRG